MDQPVRFDKPEDGSTDILFGRQRRGIQPLAAWALLAITTLVVQLRLLAPMDEAGLQWIVAHRPEGITEVMNWLFRLGFAQVDVAIALIWAAWLLVEAEVRSRRQEKAGDDASSGYPTRAWARRIPTMAPLVLFAVIGLQAGMRLLIDQPAPGSAYELQRDFASEPVGLALDSTDAAAREVFVAATAPQPTEGIASAAPAPGAVRGSYPSGHACRVLFLSLLAAGMIRGQGKTRRAATLAVALLPAALVGYSALYFGYHWPSDLLGGWLLAAALYPITEGLRQQRNVDAS